MPQTGDVVLGGVLLDTDNAPAELALPEDLTAGEEILSDGTKRLIATGWQAGDIPLTGTLRWADANGTTPLQKMDALRALLEAGVPVPLQWRDRTWMVTIRSFQPVVLANDWVRYTLTLYRATQGPFSGASDPELTLQRGFVGAMGAQAAQAPPRTAAAFAGVKAAAAPLGRP
jgi:hypothetical protein